MTKLMRATRSGEVHGLINTLTNSVPNTDFKHMEPKIKADLEKQKKEDAKIVKVEYMNARGRHERLTKPYCRYAGDPIEMWHFIPGEKYDVPYGLVKEVNDELKHLTKRSGLVCSGGNDVNKDGTPLDSDIRGDWLHKMVPVGF